MAPKKTSSKPLLSTGKKRVLLYRPIIVTVTGRLHHRSFISPTSFQMSTRRLRSLYKTPFAKRKGRNLRQELLETSGSRQDKLILGQGLVFGTDNSEEGCYTPGRYFTRPHYANLVMYEIANIFKETNMGKYIKVWLEFVYVGVPSRHTMPFDVLTFEPTIGGQTTVNYTPEPAYTATLYCLRMLSQFVNPENIQKAMARLGIEPASEFGRSLIKFIGGE